MIELEVRGPDYEIYAPENMKRSANGYMYTFSTKSLAALVNVEQNVRVAFVLI
jgi:hypothetical protein